MRPGPAGRLFRPSVLFPGRWTSHAEGGAKYAPQMLPEMQAVFGMDLVLKEQDDLFALAQKAAALPKELRPRAYITCGSDDHGDYIIEQNRKFRDHLSALPLELRYEEFPGGHEWPLWDQVGGAGHPLLPGGVGDIDGIPKT